MATPQPSRTIVKRNGRSVPFDRQRITDAIYKATVSTGQADLHLAGAMAEAVEAALESTYFSQGAIPTVEDIQDLVESTLMVNRHARIARNYIIYRHERAMIRAAKAWSFEVTDNIPYKKIYEVLIWNMEHRCESVDAMNRLIRDGRFHELVAAGEQYFAGEVAMAVARILEAIDRTRMIIVAGPSSSGKTTTLIKISERLRQAGIALKAINIDNYFFDLVQHPRDEFGDYDYEMPQSLDLPLINRHLAALMAGETVRTPHYDFKTGKRRLDVHELRLAPGEILLIDSLHGLHQDMTAAVPAEQKFRIYVETLGQFKAPDGTFMRWADHRLLRRMIRDSLHRNSQPMETLTHWHYVRRSELKCIIPFVANADCVLNTALPYELPLLKHRLFDYFEPAMARFGEDPRRQDAFVRARRVRDLLAPLEAVADDSMVPDGSLFREFIGGSRYAY